MWNRVDPSLPNNGGFDQDKVLPYRERLVIVYTYQGKLAVGEAFVHNGEWCWWGNAEDWSLKKIDSQQHTIHCWIEHPLALGMDLPRT